MPNPKKPLAIALLHGNPGKRRINKQEPNFIGRPECPEWLHPIAQREWKRIEREFSELGLLTAPDMAALAAYCQAYARWRTAEETVQHEGQMVKEPIVTRSGNSTGRYRRKKHPAVTVAKDERAAMLQAGRLFGLDPASRGRISAPQQDAPEPDEDFSDLYGPLN